jgi:prepilin signal peptidase PulO-like enzyme (type II secretory pathway)
MGKRLSGASYVYKALGAPCLFFLFYFICERPPPSFLLHVQRSRPTPFYFSFYFFLLKRPCLCFKKAIWPFFFVVCFFKQVVRPFFSSHVGRKSSHIYTFFFLIYSFSIFFSNFFSLDLKLFSCILKTLN